MSDLLSGAKLGEVREDCHGMVVPRDRHCPSQLPGVGVIEEDGVENFVVEVFST